MSGTCLLVVYHFHGNVMAESWRLALEQVHNSVHVVDVRGLGGRYERFLSRARNIMASAEEMVTGRRYHALYREYPRTNLAARVFGLAQRDDAAVIGQIRQLAEEVGPVDTVLLWWGVGILHNAGAFRTALPGATIVWCVDGYPDTWARWPEYFERRQMQRCLPEVDGVVYYSDRMQEVFETRLGARGIPGIAMIEPLMSRAFATEPAEAMERVDSAKPRVIFIGRADRLYARDLRIKKDAVGPLLEALADRGIEVHVANNATLRPGSALRRYRYFTNSELLDGTFGRFLGGFDANLVIYNEYNGVLRDQVSMSLSTRFAVALTGRCPLAVSGSARFAHDLFRDHRIGFCYQDIDDLAAKLHDRAFMASLKAGFPDTRRVFSFEACKEPFRDFLSRVRVHRGNAGRR